MRVKFAGECRKAVFYISKTITYRTQADPYLETREREELFVKQIVDAVENSLKQALPLFLSGLTAGIAQREPQIRASFPAPENSQPDSDVDWDFLGE